MDRKIWIGFLAWVVVGGLALGCQSEPLGTPLVGTPTAVVTPTEQPSATPGRPTTTPPPKASPAQTSPPSAGGEKAVAAARADLARRLKTEAAIAVESVEAVDWPSTALGCPQPGMMYAQVITPGYRIVLSVKGQRYVYHTDTVGGQVVWCEKGALMGGTPAPTVGLANPQAQRAAEAARLDLAQRLRRDPAAITVAQVYAGDFPTSDLGCPAGTPLPGLEPGPVQPAFVTGLEIVLAAGGEEYVYRVRGSVMVFCGRRE